MTESSTTIPKNSTPGIAAASAGATGNLKSDPIFRIWSIDRENGKSFYFRYIPREPKKDLYKNRYKVTLPVIAQPIPYSPAYR